jgi:kumamolisin
MRFVIHLKRPVKSLADTIFQEFKIVSFLKSKLLKAVWHPHKRMIEFYSSNPGIITHLKKKFGDLIICILSDKHGAGQYKRPNHRLTPVGHLYPKASSKDTVSAQPLSPAQVAQAYNFPAPGKFIEQKTVAIIELGGSFNQLNVDAYCLMQGVKPPQISTINIDGSVPVPDPSGADGEVSLDIDVVAALCPGVKILMVMAPNTSNGFIDAVAGLPNYSPRPDVASISWGSPEVDWDRGAMEALSNAIQHCVEQGINVMVAAGDNGSTDGTDSNVADFPSSSPYALSCGGTLLLLNSDGTRNSEVVWNELANGEGATGGGVSIVFPGRQVPDVAGNADPNSGYKVNVDGIPQAIGGTSAVAPLMAALSVLIASNTNQPLPNLKEVFYAHPDVCFDVVSGNNGAFSAGPGFDCCSGWGVPDGTKLLKLLQPTLAQKLIALMKKPVGDFFKKRNA